MVQILPAVEKRPSFLDSLGMGLAQSAPQAVDQYFNSLTQKKQEAAANEAAKRLGIDTTGLDPETRRVVLAEHLKGKNKLSQFQMEQGQKLRSEQTKSQQEDDALRQLEADRNLEPGALKSYKGNLNLAEKVTKPKSKTQASQPIDPEQRKVIQEVRSIPGFDDLDELAQYRAFTDAGVSKENAEAESKLRGAQLVRQGGEVERAYNAQKDFIDDTTTSYRAFEEQTKPKLLQMQHMPSEDIIGPTANVFLEEMGIPLGALENPSSELYSKLSLDLLKGLPETYGNRILKVEVDNFLKTIPSLMNSPDGRRMIASNMLKLGEMKGVYYNEMRRQQKDYLDSNKPMPRDFEQRVFDQVKPQIDRINDEFVKMSEITSVPPGKMPFFDPTGTIRFVDQDKADWATSNGGRRIW